MTSNESFVRLIPITRLGSETIIFLGHPSELYASLVVSDFAPRWPRLVGSGIIELVQRMLSYVVSFSAGLAVLNVIPCIAMDGQHIVGALSDRLLHKVGNKRRIVNIVVGLGTGLVALNVLAGFCSLVTWE